MAPRSAAPGSCPTVGLGESSRYSQAELDRQVGIRLDRQNPYRAILFRFFWKSGG